MRLALAALLATWAVLGCALQGGAAGTDLEQAAPSPGCGQLPRSPPSSIQVAGQIRGLVLAVPESADGHSPQPLVIAFHGRTNDNRQVRAYYGLKRTLEQRALVAYPRALRQADGTFTWAALRSQGPARPDLALFDALLGQLGQRYCIDLNRVYVVGHSLGASFANTVACARAAQVRAVATVGGGIWTRGCSSPVAAMVVHNPRDRLVAIDHSQRARDVLLAANGLRETTPKAVPGSALNCRRYGKLGARDPVLWCPHGKDYKARKVLPAQLARRNGQRDRPFPGFPAIAARHNGAPFLPRCWKLWDPGPQGQVQYQRRLARASLTGAAVYISTEPRAMMKR